MIDHPRCGKMALLERKILIGQILINCLSIISESIESYYKQDYKERKVLNEPTVMSDGRAEQSVGNILKYFRIDNDFYPL